MLAISQPFPFGFDVRYYDFVQESHAAQTDDQTSQIRRRIVRYRDAHFVCHFLDHRLHHKPTVVPEYPSHDAMGEEEFGLRFSQQVHTRETALHSDGEIPQIDPQEIA
jgi:hypothetical protein